MVVSQPTAWAIVDCPGFFMPKIQAVGVPLSEPLAQAYFVADMELSPLAAAYARARGADRTGCRLLEAGLPLVIASTSGRRWC